MGIRTTSSRLVILSLLTACSSTRLPMGRDAAVTAPPITDGQIVLPDAAIPKTDMGLISADPDTAPTIAPNPYANRSFRVGPENPAPTPDATCTQYGPTDYFQLTFGADITTMNVLMVSGSAAKPYRATMGSEASKLTYHFTDFPTGGTITFERDQGVQVAQVIMRGSGVPVLRCLRGALIPQP